jgi:hypothetical protein
MTDRKLTDAEYTMLQSQLFTFGNIVRDMPLDAMLERISKAETIAPFTNPTLHRAGIAKLELIKRMAEGLRGFQRTLPTLDEAKRLDAEAERWLELAGERG